MGLSYSILFVFLWSLIAASCGYGLLSLNREVDVNCRFQRCSYLLFSVLLVSFAAFRPIGISRDDLNYLDIFNTICPNIECGKWLQSARDWGWFSTVGVLKSLWLDPRVMLWLSAGGLIVKLWVVYRICRQPMMALLLYAGIFYQLLDLTQFRVSLASTVFFVSFYFLSRGQFFAGGLLALFSGFFHKQAFVSPLMLIGRIFNLRYSALVLFSLFPILLMQFGLYPDIPEIVRNIYPIATSEYSIAQGIEMYLQFKADGVYEGWRIAPIVYYPFVGLALFLAKDASVSSNALYRYISISVLSAAWMLWGFASLPDVQARFFEFMMMPVVFLVGICRFDVLRFGLVAAVSGIFIIKYNLLHQLISGGILY